MEFTNSSLDENINSIGVRPRMRLSYLWAEDV